MRNAWSKSFYMSRAVSNFYRTEFEIRAGLGQLAVRAEKKLGHKVCYFWGRFFMFSLAKMLFRFFCWIFCWLKIGCRNQRRVEITLLNNISSVCNHLQCTSTRELCIITLCVQQVKQVFYNAGALFIFYSTLWSDS